MLKINHGHINLLPPIVVKYASTVCTWVLHGWMGCHGKIGPPDQFCPSILVPRTIFVRQFWSHLDNFGPRWDRFCTTIVVLRETVFDRFFKIPWSIGPGTITPWNFGPGRLLLTTGITYLLLLLINYKYCTI